MENETKKPINIKLLISIGLATLGIGLILFSRKKEINPIKETIIEKENQKPIIINNYMGDKPNGKPRPIKPKTSKTDESDDKPDFTIIESVGENQSDDNGI